LQSLSKNDVRIGAIVAWYRDLVIGVVVPTFEALGDSCGQRSRSFCRF
jgi:hypothetical protein